MGLPGGTELMIIAGVIILLFGATKLPKLGGAVGESIRNFKKGIKDENPKLADESEPEKKVDSQG